MVFDAAILGAACLRRQAKGPSINFQANTRMHRGAYPEPLLPLCGIRAVRSGRANGLSITIWPFQQPVSRLLGRTTPPAEFAKQSGDPTLATMFWRIGGPNAPCRLI